NKDPNPRNVNRFVPMSELVVKHLNYSSGLARIKN
ncbi:hypothetical protein CCACVL1_00229, partial [Corchorus capsularis]